MAEARLERTRLAYEVKDLIEYYEAKAAKPKWDRFEYQNVPIDLLKEIYKELGDK